MNKNIVYIAAAGSGKTTMLVSMALEKAKTERVLLLTYTNSNMQEIKNKFYQINSCIPQNVTVQTWFSFLIQHGVKPYQDCLSTEFKNIDICGMNLVNEASAKYVAEAKASKHYLNSSNKIYSDKLSKFVFRCNEASKGKVINRITDIFQNIYIDEIQDLAGYDLDILVLLFNSKSNIILAGDPRQATYLTHWERKNNRYRFGGIIEFFNQYDGTVEIDDKTLNGSFRCSQEICEYASKLYPDFPATISMHDKIKAKQGVFLIKASDKDAYLDKFKAVQLRYDRKNKHYNTNHPVYNFGESKGLTFDNVLIYPTNDMITWIQDHSQPLELTTQARFYVALTRAKYSVGIFWKKANCNATDISFWHN